MKAMVLEKPGQPLVFAQAETPEPQPDQLLIRVLCCGVCRTDLHIVDGELTDPKLPLIPGHEVVGIVEKVGAGAGDDFRVGQRVGCPWMAYTCEHCRYCVAGKENLCEHALFTGYTKDGGYAEYMVADWRFCFHIPDYLDNEQAAPLLCAGLIGWRCLRFAENAQNLGLYGFGAAAHIIAPVAKYQGRRVFAFTSPGDTRKQEFARSLGADWAGGSDQAPPEKLDAAIIFAPVGALIPKALADVDKAGIVIAGGIHMSDIPAFPYSILWEERVVRSVANLTRQDGLEFMEMAARVKLRPTVTPYRLAGANQALSDLRGGKVEGAAVLQCT